MNKLYANTKNFLGYLPRVIVLGALLALPLVAVNQVRADNGSILESIEEKGGGIGFVLLVSLQRG
ncbi:hypothetical protein [Nitratireductor basaltis]|uniref:Uncharacterized protein n=1 Tax=Nitratireductor basaltis TaxID=472175 RepID=A0A084UCC9_9HYPH|nr:hypothetical protein [Nitratireductor basaltis]KFB10615.1 hypothetical protein EL18_01653 [Nitratireductor basaltis]